MSDRLSDYTAIESIAARLLSNKVNTIFRSHSEIKQSISPSVSDAVVVQSAFMMDDTDHINTITFCLPASRALKHLSY